MKAFFEKNPLIHYTTVLSIVAIVCGLMIGGMNAITAPIIQRNLEEKERAAYQEVLPEGQTFNQLELIDGVPSSVSGAVEGKNASGAIVGYIYTASGLNQHGSISLVISVSAEGDIIGASILAIDQTKGIDDTRSNLATFVGSSILGATPQGDLISGVTNSLNTVRSLLNDIAAAHALLADVPSDPYVASFGDGYILEDDPSFVATTNITAKKIAKDPSNTIVGYVYYLTGIGTYEGHDGLVTDKGISMEVLFDENYTVIDVFVPEDAYDHTASYRAKIVNYADSFIGKNPADFINTMQDPGDLTTGVTYTKNLVDVLLNALLDEVN